MLVQNRLKIYILSTIFVFVSILNLFRTIPDSVEDVSKYPTLSYDEIVSLNNEIRDGVKKPLSSFGEYFDTIFKIQRLELGIKKYRKLHDPMDPRIANPIVSFDMNLMLYRNENQERSRHYKEKYENEFSDAEKNRDRSLSDIVLNPIDPISEQKMVFAFYFLQFGFAPFVFMIFAIRIYLKNGSLFYEVAGNPIKFFFYLFVWEVGLFKYEATSLRQQIRQMLRFASLVLTTALSFGGATAKAQSKDKEEAESSGKNAHTLVISGTSEYLSMYLGLDGAVFHPNPVLQSSLTLAHKSGVYVNFWKSVAMTKRNHDPNFGSEEDYTFGYSKKIFGKNIDSSVTYFNVTPLQRVPRGDLLQSSVNISDFISRLKIPNYLLVRNVSPLKDGIPKGAWFVHFGTNKDFKYKKTKFAFGSEAVFDSGGFGYKRAGVLRSSASLKIPFKNFVLDLPIYRMSTPFTGPNDGRKFEQVLGVGLSFSSAQ